MHKPSIDHLVTCAGCDTSKDTIDVVRRTEMLAIDMVLDNEKALEAA